MADTPKKSLRIVVVTPEKAVLDELAELVTLPLYDGEYGILPNHAPIVAQLGPGELRIRLARNEADPTGLDRNLVIKNLFIDGGFVQVANNTINVLTQFARAKADLSETLIAAERAKVEALPTSNDAEKATKAKMTARVAAMARLASKA